MREKKYINYDEEDVCKSSESSQIRTGNATGVTVKVHDFLQEINKDSESDKLKSRTGISTGATVKV